MAKNPESLKNLKPGNKRGPSKITALLKDEILQAADNAHPEGRVAYLAQQAKEQPAAFMALLGKVLPTQVSGDPDQPIIHEVIRRIVRA